MHCYGTTKWVYNLNGTLGKFSFVSWEHIIAMTFLSILGGRPYWEMPSVFRKAQKKEDFWEVDVLPFLFPFKQVTQTCEHTGPAAQAQQQSPKQLFPQTWVNIWTGSSLQWRVKSLLPAAEQQGRYTPARPWGPPPALKAPNDTWAGERQRFILFQLPATHAASWTCLFCVSSVSPDVRLKRQQGLQTRFLFASAVLIGWGEKRPLMCEVGLNSPEPSSPKVTHCFRVLYLRVGLGLDGAVFIFLLSAALLISEKNNQPICSMLRNKNKIISTF